MCFFANHPFKTLSIPNILRLSPAVSTRQANSAGQKFQPDSLPAQRAFNPPTPTTVLYETKTS